MSQPHLTEKCGTARPRRFLFLAVFLAFRILRDALSRKEVYRSRQALAAPENR